VRNKTSSFNTVMRLWAAYSGELSSINAESGIVLNDSLINRPLDPSGMAQLVNLFNSEILSHETVLGELQRGGVLDPDLRIQEELKRISKEKTQRVAESVVNVVQPQPINEKGPTGKAEPVTQNPLAKQ
jgi:hypothetical protein